MARWAVMSFSNDQDVSMRSFSHLVSKMAYPLISQCSEHSARHNCPEKTKTSLMTDNVEQDGNSYSWSNKKVQILSPDINESDKRDNEWHWTAYATPCNLNDFVSSLDFRYTMFLCYQDLVLYYFSAHWCPPCRQFTPMLKDFYEVTRLLMKIKIKHVFVRKLRESRLSLFLLIARLRTWPPTWR